MDPMIDVVRHRTSDLQRLADDIRRERDLHPSTPTAPTVPTGEAVVRTDSGRRLRAAAARTPR